MFGLETLLMTVLGAFRIGGLLLAMPVFGTAPFPPQLKFLFAVGFAFLLRPFLGGVPENLWHSNAAVVGVVVRELMIGIVIGMAVRFLFTIVSMALEFTSLQIGFGIGGIFDPETNMDSTILSHFGMLLATLFFVGSNLHYELFATLVKSYEKLPIGGEMWNLGSTVQHLVLFLRVTFETSMRLAAPIMVAMLVIHIVMGIISRTAPQMNLFFNVSFVINVTSGLALITFMLPRALTLMERFVKSLSQSGYGLW